MQWNRVAHDVRLPVPSSQRARTYDVFTHEECTLAPCEKRVVGTGVAIRLPRDVLAVVRACPGVRSVRVHEHCIVPDYCGEIRVLVENATGGPLTLPGKSAIASLQLVAL